ncbi:MAG: bifunctional glutamine-synthetase adenylyltransferase/deadenyltransferase, partial [Acidimicrobiia bacterium]|nr:bifunctional glutamine-synthetase adenylyltransferase/deadenyltransferase [Acidimicrobiia bacterium]
MNPISVLDARPVTEAIDASADAAAARTALARIIEAHPDAADALRDDDTFRAGLVAVTCASRSLVNAIVQDAALLGPLRDGVRLTDERGLDEYRAAMGIELEADPDGARALRRWKRREYLRIAARDLLGLAALPAVGRELAALAEVCLGTALRLVDPQIRFAIIGMGKLGGSELNYASDVDVLFVHDGAGEEADRIARAVLATMTTPSADGIVFRTDVDLRPEGRSGALSRNLDAYAAWYERWARHWEFQALLKARPVAGDAALGNAFMALSRPYVWPEHLDPDAVREVRTMKARAEAELHKKGLTDRELKRGRGGIRDVEFAVQL